jgi:hypothetical protein
LVPIKNETTEYTEKMEFKNSFRVFRVFRGS